MCSKDLKASGAILTRLDESHFYTDEGKEAYARILSLFQRKGEPPNFRLLCQDGGLTEDTREFLKSAEGVAKSPGQIDQLLGSLNEYRQTRLYYSLARKLLKRLEAPTINPDELSELVSGIISKIQLKRSAEADIIHIGKDSNVREALEELIYGENQDNCIPTGFKTFDVVNGGFFRGSLVTLGGTSGAGKCSLPETEVTLSTLVIELEDGKTIEFEPEERIFVNRDGLMVEILAGDLRPGDDLAI